MSFVLDHKRNEETIFKRWVAVIDRLLLKGTLQARYERLLQSLLVSDLGYRVVTHYRKDVTNELAKLCDYYGSDKGELKQGGHPYPWPSHNYTDYYSRIFSHSRDITLKVFECGLGTNNPEIPSSMGSQGKPGASLRVWRDYFPNATIWGGRH